MFSLEGAQALSGWFAEADEHELAAAAAQGMRDEMERTAQEARAACPVDTGALKDSIRVEYAQSASGAEAALRADAPHAAAVELGTMKRRAQPFLYPAYNANQARLTDAIAEAARRALGEP